MTAQIFRRRAPARARRSVAGIHPALASVALILAGWWLLSLEQPRYRLPGPIDVLRSLWDMAFVSGTLWPALGLSVGALIIGGGISLGVGVPLGILMGARPSVERVFDLYVIGLYIAPVSALTPLFVFWLGLGLAPRVATIVVFTAPEVIITCFRGARQVPRTLVDVARAYGASERTILRSVIVPHEVPYIMTAARLGLGRAIKGVVLAELLVSSTGFARLINEAAHDFDTSSLIAIILVMMVMGIGGTYIVGHFERAVAPWRKAR